jgi:hypothetical protein
MTNNELERAGISHGLINPGICLKSVKQLNILAKIKDETCAVTTLFITYYMAQTEVYQKLAVPFKVDFDRRWECLVLECHWQLLLCG